MSSFSIPPFQGRIGVSVGSQYGHQAGRGDSHARLYPPPTPSLPGRGASRSRHLEPFTVRQPGQRLVLRLAQPAMELWEDLVLLLADVRAQIGAEVGDLLRELGCRLVHAVELVEELLVIALLMI